MTPSEREAFEAWWYSAPAEPKQAAWEAWQEATRQARAASQPAQEPVNECADNDSPWLVCKPCNEVGKCAKQQAEPVGHANRFRGMWNFDLDADKMPDTDDPVPLYAAPLAVPSDQARQDRIDAERYRWLRATPKSQHVEHGDFWWSVSRQVDGFGQVLREAELDAAIDAYLAKAGKP